MQLISQYRGLKKEIYILFIGKLVTAMGSFVWPMLTFFLTTKLGLSDGTSTLLIATAVVHSIFSSLTQYFISFMLILWDSNYLLIWIVFMVLGLASAGMYGFLYGPDKRTFPRLYEKN